MGSVPDHKKPTFDQECYAGDLVSKLREESVHGADSYARKVSECEDRAEMSKLIGEMKEILIELGELDRHLRDA